MESFLGFEEYLSQGQAQISLFTFVLNLTLTGIAAFILKTVYVKFGLALSNRTNFGYNFVLISMTTMVIITVVKSSLALSLGLVGALSIVRFRSAIKEPEELAYLFISVAIGLGFGANQALITITGLIIIVAMLIFVRRSALKEADSSVLYLTIIGSSDSLVDVNPVIEILEEHCTNVDLKRLDDSADVTEASFLVGFDTHKKLFESRQKLKAFDANLQISFLDNSKIF